MQLPELFSYVGAEQFNNDQIFKLTEEQKTTFLNWFNAESRTHVVPHQRLYDYLDIRLDGFDYRGDTFIARDALANGAGNCMTLAILTKALADLAGVEVSYQLVNAAPVYRKRQDVLTLSYHVRSYLYDPTYEPEEGMMVFRRPGLIVDYFPNRYDVPGGLVSDEQFLSMYYRNLAAEDLINNKLEAAWKTARYALELAPGDAENINMLAVIYRRLGYLETAESLFEYGIGHNHNNSNLMSNFALLLESTEREDEAKSIRRKLHAVKDDNPYAWIRLGVENHKKQYYRRAITYFKKALDIAPYLDEPYFGLARSYYENEQYQKAAEAMAKAAENAWEEDKRNLYYAKLSKLKSS